MIHSGRKISNPTNPSPKIPTHLPKKARLTAVFGALAVTVFFCLAAKGSEGEPSFFAGAVQASTPVSTPVLDGDSPALVPEDGSIWAYFESLLRDILLGE